MIGELGHFALMLALGFALLLSWLPLWSLRQGQESWQLVVTPLALGLTVSVGLSFALLVAAFVQDDFSLAYVTATSNTDLPLLFKVAAAWGAHEGSMLLWLWLMTLWLAAVALASGRLGVALRLRLLSVMGMVALGFVLFLLLTSSPFERLLVVPEQGRSLNPLLQDVALVAHPPLLYLGYVGFLVAFAWAVAVLWQGEMDARAARWLRPWVSAAWLFLTLGIALGSWWAYYELGWGGFWFWDPVENASLLPWLTGTALLHSLAVSEKRGQFRAWTLLLALLAFSLALLGTFLVRSGVLTSVHAFTSDPSRGVFILLFLAVVAGGALMLFSARAHLLARRVTLSPLSREMTLLLNNALLLVMMATVLLGTLYPLLLDALSLGKISVGAPYFNTVMLPLSLPLVLLMGLGMWLHWRADNARRLWSVLRIPLLLVALMLALFPLLWWDQVSGLSLLGVLGGSWVGFSALWWWWCGAGHRLSAASLGPMLAHVGFAVSFAGILLTSAGGQEKDVRMLVGEPLTLAGYTFVLEGVQEVAGPNYLAQQGRVRVSDATGEVALLLPEKRRYIGFAMPMTEAGIDAGLTRDVFVALGEPLGDAAWSLRLQVKPFVRWVWLGAVLMALGALVALLQRRYRVRGTAA